VLTLFPNNTATLPLRYYGNIAYYATMAAYGTVQLQIDALFDKRQKSVHRCDIADTHGPVQLTVPIAKPHGIAHARWSDIQLSDHGDWWHVHRVTLESAYGRTPFFEFYIDRFLPFLQRDVMDHYPTLAALNLAIDSVLRDILLIPTTIVTASPAATATAIDDAGTIHSVDGMGEANLYSGSFPPYYQVRADKQGFRPNLSVLDLIFNLGPESPLYLQRLLATTH
jgi:hypothetical protein